VTKDARFLRYYDQELRFVRDLAGEFASEHARIANRFGLDADTCADPHVEWLLDGCAFLAARVQHKLDGDYAVFTQHLLEMVYPDYLPLRPPPRSSPSSPARTPRRSRTASRCRRAAGCRAASCRARPAAACSPRRTP
jgi:type VI protein secretion system component VasA